MSGSDLSPAQFKYVEVRQWLLSLSSLSITYLIIYLNYTTFFLHDVSRPDSWGPIGSGWV